MMCLEASAAVFASVCTGFEQSLKDAMRQSSAIFKKHQQNHILSSNQVIERHIKRNKHWTDIWKLMIEQHQHLIQILSYQHDEINSKKDMSWNKNQVRYIHHQINRSLPSPFSTSNSTTPLPNDIIMAQFYPMHQNSIPVTPPKPEYEERPSIQNSISKKKLFFFKSQIR